MKSPEKLYKFHVANLRSVDTALQRIALSLRAAVSKDDHKNIDVFTRLYALLLGTWAECRLSKLLYEPCAFTDVERDAVRDVETHLERWQRVVEIAYRKHYEIKKATLTSKTLSHSAFTRYQAIVDLLNDDLCFVITLRNKLAHGQWIYPLNDSGDDVAQEQMDSLREENVLSLQYKRSIIDSLLNAVSDLTLSKTTFERDFDNHYRRVEQTRQRLENVSYEKYARSMRAKFRRGKSKRNKST